MAEKQTSELGDRIVEIAEAEQNKEKTKEIRTLSATTVTTLSVPTLKL